VYGINGWVGKILKVDLSSGKIETEPTESYVDQHRGIPTREKLTELGLDEMAAEVLGRKD